MEYIVLISESHIGLSRKVNKHLSKGWIVVGGVASDSVYLYQAMTRTLCPPRKR
jgi:hypothetical protein